MKKDFSEPVTEFVYFEENAVACSGPGCHCDGIIDCAANCGMEY